MVVTLWGRGANKSSADARNYMTIKTTELKRSTVIDCASLGADILSEICKELDRRGIGREMALACLASAVCGAMKASMMTVDEFIEGVETCDQFWKTTSDEVVFLQPDTKQVDEMFDKVVRGGN